jgi:hypothetical protein
MAHTHLQKAMHTSAANHVNEQSGITNLASAALQGSIGPQQQLP